MRANLWLRVKNQLSQSTLSRSWLFYFITMANKQTAVSFIDKEIIKHSIFYRLSIEDQMEIRRIIKRAKKIEKEQIIKAFGNIQRTSEYDDKGNFIISDITSEYYYQKNYGSI